MLNSTQSINMLNLNKIIRKWYLFAIIKFACHYQFSSKLCMWYVFVSELSVPNGRYKPHFFLKHGIVDLMKQAAVVKIKVAWMNVPMLWWYNIPWFRIASPIRNDAESYLVVAMANFSSHAWFQNLTKYSHLDNETR